MFSQTTPSAPLLNRSPHLEVGDQRSRVTVVFSRSGFSRGTRYLYTDETVFYDQRGALE